MRSLVLLLLLAAPCAAEEIPLKSIWGRGLSGTQDMEDLEPEIFKKAKDIPAEDRYDFVEKSAIRQFNKTLKSLSRGEEPKPGFAVSGEGREALDNALKARLSHPSENIPAGKATAVFFTHNASGNVMLERVIREGNRVEVQFRNRLFPTATSELNNSFALIPLGELAPGKYEVDIVAKGKNQPANVVCRPFSFTVEEP